MGGRETISYTKTQPVGRRTHQPVFNSDGFSYVRNKIRAEKKARREVWKDWASVIAPFISGLIGVLAGTLTKSC